MSKAKYQLLSSSDQTPALEVNLTIVNRDAQLNDSNHESIAGTTSSSSSQQQQASSVIVATSLNENTTSNNHQIETIQVNLIPVDSTTNLPPASELPSYTEAVKLKKLGVNEFPPSYFSSVHHADDTRINLEPIDIRAIVDSTESSAEQDIGSECMFLSAFMIAFFFNWIGFFASICLLPNAAGKYGALSGFGLSMAKWVTIVRYQEWMTNMNDFQQKIFFWLFIFLGFYLFFRGLINYMTLKYRPRNEYSRRIRDRWFGVLE